MRTKIPAAVRASCPPKPRLAARPLIGAREASELGKVFKVLADQARLRLLHALVRSRELSVNDLARAVAMKPQAVSNQLQRLADRDIVAARRSGTSMFYRIVDPCISKLLDRGMCLVEDTRRRRSP